MIDADRSHSKSIFINHKWALVSVHPVLRNHGQGGSIDQTGCVTLAAPCIFVVLSLHGHFITVTSHERHDVWPETWLFVQQLGRAKTIKDINISYYWTFPRNVMFSVLLASTSAITCYHVIMLKHKLSDKLFLPDVRIELAMFLFRLWR